MSLEGELVPVTSMRAAIARRMTESKQQAPHFYVSAEIETDALSSVLAEEGDRAGVRISATAGLVRAAAGWADTASVSVSRSAPAAET